MIINTIKKRVAVTGLVCSLFTGGAVADVIKLQTENFPPYNFSTQGKNFAKQEDVSGISVDIVKEMFQRANVPMNITLRFPWKRVYEMAATKPNYGVFSMVRTEERESAFHWIGPLAPDEWVLFARHDSPITIASLEDAKRLKVGGYKGDALTDYLDEQGLTVAAASQDKHNIRKLQSGGIDLWASNNYSAQVLAKQAGVDFAAFKPVFRVDMVDLYLGLHPSIPKGTVDRLQNVLEEMRKEGRIDAIIQSYIQ